MRFSASIGLALGLLVLATACATNRRRSADDEIPPPPDAGTADASPVGSDGGGGVPAHCSDGRRSGDETHRDCGGTCPQCPDGSGCRNGGDCTSGVCGGGFCLVPSCSDAVQNGDEAGPDCGGSCVGCPGGTSCTAAEDCLSGVCESGACTETSCFDGIVNADETDVDCGGSCPGCDGGGACVVAEDCASLICESGACTAPSCEDLVQNQGESDVDCGGAACPGCGDLRACTTADDCLSRVCESGACSLPTCMDGTQNQDETDADCGGETCGPCADGGSCTEAADCASGVCTGGACQAPSCTDGVANGMETDVDCGGATSCARCDDYRVCTAASDCSSATCTMGRCGDTGCVPFGTDSYGYFGCSLPLTASTVPCPDIRTTGTATGLSDDSQVSVTLPFSFDFYGTARSSVTIQSNGTLTFTGTYLTYGNTCLPTSSITEFIAVMWDDLDPGNSGSNVYYQTLGTAPNRTFVVQWDTERFSTTPSRADLRLVLHEGSSDIHVCYANGSFSSSTYDHGASATAGIQGAGTSLQFSCNTASLDTGLFLQYIHP